VNPVKFLWICVLISAGCFFPVPGRLFAFATDPVIRVTLEPDSIRIGEQSRYSLSVDFRGDEGESNITWPELREKIGEYAEILDTEGPDTIIPDKEKDDLLFRIQQSFVIIAFDSGYHLLPPQLFIFNGDTFYSEALFLSVNTVPVDTSQAFRDIKDILEVPLTFGEWLSENWPWLASAVAALMLIAAGWVYFRKKKKAPEPEAPREPTILPHVEALLNLSELERKKLWQEGQHKKYHSRLTGIVRYYIERRFGIPALEQTTDEIMQAMKYAVLPIGASEKLRRMLMLADIVKFAKGVPVGQENELAMSDAREFVNLTRRISVEDEGIA